MVHYLLLKKCTNCKENVNKKFFHIILSPLKCVIDEASLLVGYNDNEWNNKKLKCLIFPLRLGQRCFSNDILFHLKVWLDIKSFAVQHTSQSTESSFIKSSHGEITEGDDFEFPKIEEFDLFILGSIRYRLLQNEDFDARVICNLISNIQDDSCFRTIYSEYYFYYTTLNEIYELLYCIEADEDDRREVARMLNQYTVLTSYYFLEISKVYGDVYSHISRYTTSLGTFYEDIAGFRPQIHISPITHRCTQPWCAVRRYTSNINGNNGSYTNTDDHDTPKEKHDARKREHKSAALRRIHSKAPADGKHKKVTCGPPASSIVAPVEPTAPTLPRLKPAYFHNGHLFLIEDRKIKRIMDKFELYEGINLNISPVKLPPFSMFGRDFAARTVQFTPELYNYMKLCLRVLPNEPRNYTACHMFIVDTFSFFEDAQLSLDTLQVFCFKNQVSSTPHNITGIATDLGIPMSCGSLFVQPTELSNVPGWYKFNRAWNIESSHGFEFELGPDGTILKCNFKTHKEIQITDKNKRRYFSFTPKEPFQVYANCAHNVEQALRRYFKVVSGGWKEEELRRARQMKLISGIPVEVLSNVADALGANLTPVRTRRREITVITFKPALSYGEPYVRYDQVHHHCPRNNQSTMLRIIDKYGQDLPAQIHFMRFQDSLRAFFGPYWDWVIDHAYSPAYQWLDSYELLKVLTFLPHPKRALYRNYVENQLSRIIANDGQIESKFKWEFGKVGKVGRLYASGQWLTLFDHVVCPFVKQMMEREIFVGEGFLNKMPCDFYLEFCDCQEVNKCNMMYSKLLDMKVNSLKLVFFSDDGFIIYKSQSGIEIYETDFSSCDSTNGFAVFTAYAYLASKVDLLDRATGIIKQCGFSTTLRNPDNRSEYVTLTPTEGFMYSGNNGTTGFNNIAEIGFFSKLYDNCVEDGGQVLSEDLIKKSAFDGGWEMTVVRRYNLNAGTFLKRAYDRVSGRSWLVYGAILRSFGSIDGPPTPDALGVSPSEFRKMNLDAQMLALLKMKAESLVNEPPSPIVEAIRMRAGLQTEARPYEVSYEALNERYGTTNTEWYILKQCILDLRLGDVIINPALEKIFHVDYGSVCSENLTTHVQKLADVSVFDRYL